MMSYLLSVKDHIAWLGKARARFFRIYPLFSVFSTLFQNLTMFYLALKTGATWVWWVLPVGVVFTIGIVVLEFSGMFFEAEYSLYFNHTPENVELLERVRRIEDKLNEKFP